MKSCNICTYNKDDATECELCHTELGEIKEKERYLKLRTPSDEEFEMVMKNSLNDKYETTTTCLYCTLKNNITNTNCEVCGKELLFNKWRTKYLKKSLDNGNCLYSSVYLVLKDKDKLSFVREMLDLNISTEEKFIESLRNKISDHADSDIEYFLNNKKIYEQSDMGNFSLTSLEGALEGKSTLQNIKDNIKKDKVYATFLEYLIIKRFLEICNIEIILITNDVFKDNIEYDIDAENIIYIYNYDNSHYQYFYNDKKHKDGKRKKSKSFRRKKSKSFRRKKSKSFRRKKSKSFRRKKSKSFRRKNEVIYKQK